MILMRHVNVTQHWITGEFLPRDAMLARQIYLFIYLFQAARPIYRTVKIKKCYGPVSVSVCLSVTSRCSTKTARRGITLATPHKNTGTNSSFMLPKISPKFDRGQSLRGRDFRQIAGSYATYDQTFGLTSLI